jgi:oligogalacturonide lyase
MAKGRVLESEASWFTDPGSGRRIRQVTAHPSIHHHPFFFVNAYDDAMRWLFFVSHRTGAPQLFAERREDGALIQLTARDDLAEWSLSPSHNGRFVVFTAGAAAWRLDMATLEEEQLADFGAVAMREAGMVGAAMGTTALSWDDRWWAVPVRTGDMTRFFLFDLERGTHQVILERDTIGHPQFCPFDPELIFYAGPLVDRVWAIRRDGSDNRRLYRRTGDAQWITHESWIPGSRRLAFVDWPHGMRWVDAVSGEVGVITVFPAWHAVADGKGERFVCDTNFPDRGLHLIAAADGAATPLCAPRASSIGAHWAASFPYNDGPVAVYAPQHTHPHPRFSPDGTRVVFTSDRGGNAQLYECPIDDHG